jgi:hypothetical protein
MQSPTFFAESSEGLIREKRFDYVLRVVIIEKGALCLWRVMQPVRAIPRDPTADRKQEHRNQREGGEAGFHADMIAQFCGGGKAKDRTERIGCGK